MAAIGQLPPVEGRTPRDLRMTARIRAPEARRIAVKVAASIAVSRSAIRHSRELLAKASMASAVRRAVRRLGGRAIILRLLPDRGPPGPLMNLEAGLEARGPARSVAQAIELYRVIARHLAAGLG